MEKENQDKKGISINVIDWKTGNREVAITFSDINYMLTISAESARMMAFVLMECADYIEPPFEDEIKEDGESEAFFGPHDENEDESYIEEDADYGDSEDEEDTFNE